MAAPADSDSWPFDQPRNCATIALRQVLEGEEPILLVSHHDDDHAWSFGGSSGDWVEDGRVVCLEHVVHQDPSVLEVADLPLGWHAVREYVGGPWRRCETPPERDDD